jgi:elongation factor P
MGLEMDGAVQHAPQSGRQSINALSLSIAIGLAAHSNTFCVLIAKATNSACLKGPARVIWRDIFTSRKQDYCNAKSERN